MECCDGGASHDPGEGCGRLFAVVRCCGRGLGVEFRA